MDNHPCGRPRRQPHQPPGPRQAGRGTAGVGAQAAHPAPRPPARMSANASAQGRRTAVLASPVADFAGWRLSVNRGDPQCRGERTYALSSVAALQRVRGSVRDFVRRLRCCARGRAPHTVHIETGPELTARGRLRRVSVIGPPRAQADP